MARPLRRAYFLSLCFMKKILTVLFFFASFYLSAQEYKPRETWPFLYEYFTEGATRTRAGDLVSDAQFNISVLDGTLMYISKDNTIMQADMRSVFTARIGDEAYLNLSGKLYRILSELDKENKERLLNIIPENTQVIITNTDINNLDIKADYKLIELKEGYDV